MKNASCIVSSIRSDSREKLVFAWVGIWCVIVFLLPTLSVLAQQQTDKNEEHRCGTAQAIAEFHRLRKTSSELLTRLNSTDTAISAGGRFRVLYNRVGPTAPDLTDTGGNGIPDYVDSALAISENVYAAFIAMGYCDILAVAGERYYDIYLDEFNGRGLYGVTFPERMIGIGGDNGRFSTYIVIDNNFSPNDKTRGGRQQYYETGIRALKITLAHELYHSFQLTCYGDSYQHAQIHEATAVGMELRLYPEIYDYEQYLSPLFRDFSNYAFGESGSGNPAQTGYSSGILADMIQRRHGDSVFLRLWELSRVQVPLFRAFDSSLREVNSSIDNEWCTFADWAYFTGRRAQNNEFFPRAATYPEVTPFEVIDFSPPSVMFGVSLRSLEVRYVKIILPRSGVATADSVTLAIVNTNGRNAGGVNSPVEATFTISEQALTPNSEPIQGTRYFVTRMDNNSPLCVKAYSESGFIPCRFEQAFPSPFKALSDETLFFPLPADYEQCDTAQVQLLLPNGTPLSLLNLPIRFEGTCPVAPWNGLLPNGERLSSGVYIYAITCGNATSVGKFTAIRQ